MNDKTKQNLKGKLVAFNYKGGSKFGKRIVLVNDIVGDLINGIDVSKMEVNKYQVEGGFRRYKIGKISGNIKVIS